jgi:phage terminase small subunit
MNEFQMHRTRRNGKPVLTAREEAFISAYPEGSSKDAPSAAAEAGYKSPHKIASQLMHQPHIVAEIKRRKAIRRESEEFDIDKLLEWSAYSATFDPTTIFKPGTKELLPMAKWPDQRLCRMVESIRISTDKNGTKHVEIKFMSRTPSFYRMAMLMGVLKKNPVVAKL